MSYTESVGFTESPDIKSFTYSEYFDPIISYPNISSDIGWGCMHRSAQMLLYRALYRVLGEGASYHLQDEEDRIYSIQSLLKCSIEWGLKIDDRWSPGLACQAFKIIGEENKQILGGITFINCTNGIDKENLIETNFPIILTIPMRLGCHKSINKCFQNAFSVYINLNSCAGAIGGKGNRGFFFYKTKNKATLDYMDPHVVKRKNTNEFPVKKNSIQFKDIDPCMALAFVFKQEHDKKEFIEAVELQEFVDKQNNFITWQVSRNTLSVTLDESSDWECLV